MLRWILFLLLSLIWGSSFILMKGGLQQLSAVQVASLRIVSAGVVMLPLAVRGFATLKGKQWLFVFLSGLLGSFFPAFLYCMAQTGLDSSLAGALNSLTPIFVILTGVLFFALRTTTAQVAGILIAFLGCMGLFLSQGLDFSMNKAFYMIPVLLATFCYGLNVNVVQRYCRDIPPIRIVAVAMVMCGGLSLGVLYGSEFFRLSFSDPKIRSAAAHAVVLGALGTSLANILFYLLIRKAGPVFASMVTYGIPFVALFWGKLDGEPVGILQMLSLTLILAGVYVAGRKTSAGS